LCGQVLELIMGEIKQLEVPILIGIAVIGGLLILWHRRRRSQAPATLNS
jgi:LPXTG-motif cell wall-anchored protein